MDSSVLRRACAAMGSCAIFAMASCSPPASSSEPIGRTTEAAVTTAIRSLNCPNSSYVYNLSADSNDWQRICRLSPRPAFVVVDDLRNSDGNTEPGDTTAAPGFFHAFAPGLKVLKYIPTNYARTGISMSATCPLAGAVHPNCDNSTVDFQCQTNPSIAPTPIRTRIQRALHAGYDGVFFDEAPTATSQYINQCGDLVKHSMVPFGIADDENRLVIINPGSYPQSLSVFTSNVDIVALENATLQQVAAGTLALDPSIDAERWLGIETTTAALAPQHLHDFKSHGAFWYYGTAAYSMLPDWLESINTAASIGRPECSTTQAFTSSALTANQGLLSGTSQSTMTNGPFALKLSTDGNLSLTQNGTSLWSTATAGSLGGNAVMQGDGNFVLYKGYNRDQWIWATQTYGQTGSRLALQGDGNLVVYNSSNVPIWSRSMPAPPTVPGAIQAGQGLNGGVSMTSSPQKKATLTMQLDGNLVLSHVTAGVLWRSNTVQSTNGNLSRAFLQGDGNFVVYRSDAPTPPRFATNTFNHAGDVVWLQDDGNLVVYDSGGTPIWATNTSGTAWSITRRAVDWDLDFRSDRAVWRPSSGTWFIVNSANGATSQRQWGQAGDIPVPGDYDDDLKGDFAVWRPSTGQWFVISSRTNSQAWTIQLGQGNDVPVPADYDGDGATDRAVWRPSTGNWYIGTNAPIGWGQGGDIPVPGDYDGDGRSDVAVWRPSTGVWWILQSTNGGVGWQWGEPGDIPVPADYDGDGRTDLAIWRPSTGAWWIVFSRTWSGMVVQWGVYGDNPVPGDYDGDGKADFVVWRPSEGNWYVVRSSDWGVTVDQWGLPGDVPVP